MMKRNLRDQSGRRFPLPNGQGRHTAEAHGSTSQHETQGHAGQGHAGHGHAGHDHAGHDHASMVTDFRRRFWASLAVTVPVLALSPMIQEFLGLREALFFPGSDYVLFALSEVDFYFGGWPFLAGLFSELARRRPGMMTLIALAITVAFVYSGAVVLGLS